MITKAHLRNAGDFNITGPIISVPGATTAFPGRAVLCSRTIPSGAQAFLESWSAKVIDVGNANQIYFQVLLNGTPIQAGLERVPGVQFDYQPQLPLNVFVNSGLIEIVAFNISGMPNTIEPDAGGAAFATNCQAWLIGRLLSERGGL